MDGPDTAHGFLERIDQSGDCWTWTGTWQANGYPLVKFQGRQWLVHRLAYSLLVGPLNADQHLHKACGGAGCVRPSGGHWGLSRRHVPGPRSDLPRGVRYEGTDKRGMDVWRISVYLGRDQRRKRVEQRVRVHGTLEQALRKRDQLLARLGEERRKLATGVRGKTMAELLDRSSSRRSAIASHAKSCLDTSLTGTTSWQRTVTSHQTPSKSQSPRAGARNAAAKWRLWRSAAAGRLERIARRQPVARRSCAA